MPFEREGGEQVGVKFGPCEWDCGDGEVGPIVWRHGHRRRGAWMKKTVIDSHGTTRHGFHVHVHNCRGFAQYCQFLRCFHLLNMRVFWTLWSNAWSSSDRLNLCDQSFVRSGSGTIKFFQQLLEQIYWPAYFQMRPEPVLTFSLACMASHFKIESYFFKRKK